MKRLIFLAGLAVLILIVPFEGKAADIEAKLNDAAGASAFSVKDSGSAEAGHIDSDGNTVIRGGLRLDSSGAECTTAENLIVDGNVGIGTTVPGAKLSFVADTVAAGGIDFGGDVTLYRAAANLLKTDDKLLVRVNSVAALDVQNSSGTSYLTVDTISGYTLIPNGNVGIGTTSPSYQLQLSTDSAAKPTTNLWTIASDERIKKNISDFSDGLNIVMKLKPRTYQYNGLGGVGYDDTNTHIGFVAQEVEPVAPYMVETRQGSIGGRQISDFKNYQGHALPFILVNAVKEQQKEIKDQQKEIEELKRELIEVKKRMEAGG